MARILQVSGSSLGGMETPYRSSDGPEPDRETPAIAELDRLVRGVRSRAIVITFLLVIPVCVQEVQFSMNGRAFIWLNASLGCGLPMIAAFKLVDRIVPRVISKLVDRWLPLLAEKHGVPVEDLAEYTSHLR